MISSEPRDPEQYQSDNSEKLQKITEEEAHRLYKQHRQKQSSQHLTVQDQAASPTLRSSPGTARRGQNQSLTE